MLRFSPLLLLVAVLVAVLGAFASDFPPLKNTEKGGSAPPMSATEAAAKMQVPPGFRVDVFASEPAVQNPIAMAWDRRGRMWVAENYTYAERTQRFDLSMRDRVLILEDADNDGKAESRKVFTDQVQMLTSVEVGKGGVWLMCPPSLLFVPDANGDDVPDGPAETILDGFTVAKESHHNFANGLRWGPDGWLYGRCGHSCPGNIGVPGTPDDKRVPIRGGIWRFHPVRKVVEVLTHGTTNPWGHDWDAKGELFFINTVNGHLWHVMPGAHLREPSGVSINPGVYERLDTIADHYHFDTKSGWMNSRDGKANDFGGGHAHCGMMIYQGTQFPEVYRNKLFTLNLHGRRANVERLDRLGAGFVGRHEPDVFLSADPWFRGMEITTGPDGSAYILDWSDMGECHESTGVHRTSGRIYKISYKSNVTLPKPLPPMITPGCLAGEGRLPKLWKEYQNGMTTPQSLRRLLEDPDESVRVWAFRLLTDFWPLDTLMGPLKGSIYPDDPETVNALLRIAENDKSGLVQLALASTLQRFPLSRRGDLAARLVAHEEFAKDANLPLMVWFGLIPLGEPGDNRARDLVRVALASRWPDTTRLIARHLSLGMERNPEPVGELVTRAQGLPPLLQESILAGMREAFQGWRKAPKPAGWDAFALSAVPRSKPDLTRELETLFGDGRAMDEIRQIVLNDKADLRTRQKALQTLIDSRPPDLRKICEAVLGVRTLNITAVRGLALFDDPAIARRLVEGYGRFGTTERPAVLDTLVSRPHFAFELLKNLGSGAKQIPRNDLTAYHARQIRALNDIALTNRLVEVWGELRDSPADKKKQMEDLRQKLKPENIAKADLSQGRFQYQKACASCHMLYGEGQKVGPDLTGSGRSNIDYLLENMVDPGAVVGADYRMSIVALQDGRVLTGLVTSKNDKTLTLRGQNDTITLSISDIAEIKPSTSSLMPEGLLQALSPDQVRDLFAYLMYSSQVPLPGALKADSGKTEKEK